MSLALQPPSWQAPDVDWGLHELLVTRRLQEQLDRAVGMEGFESEVGEVDDADAPHVMARHVHQLTQRALSGERDPPSTTSASSPTGQRYIRGESTKLLFVREEANGQFGTAPYVFVGPVEYVSHEGDRPIAFTWQTMSG